MITIDVEALLHWAWTIELPKATPATEPVTVAPSTWSSEEARRRGGWSMQPAMVDVDDPDFRNRFGVTPDRGARTGPHPDAVTLWEAVKALDETDFVFPDGWSPYGDFNAAGGDLGAEGEAALVKGLERVTFTTGDGTRIAKSRLTRQIVERRAILGGCPEWRFDVPERRHVLAAHGQHPAWFRMVTLLDKGGKPYLAEVDGFNPRSRRPHADAYRKTFLDPDPIFAVVARAEYQLWRMALDTIVGDVGGRLTAHRLASCRLSFTPWQPGA